MARCSKVTHFPTGNHPEKCSVKGCKGKHVTFQQWWRVREEMDTYSYLQLGALLDPVGSGSTDHVENEMCSVKGCKEQHTASQHWCLVCLEFGVNHVTEECPDKCVIKGCGGYHLTSEHPRGVCLKTDHSENNCPTPIYLQMGALSGRTIRPWVRKRSLSNGGRSVRPGGKRPRSVYSGVL